MFEDMLADGDPWGDDTILCVEGALKNYECIKCVLYIADLSMCLN